MLYLFLIWGSLITAAILLGAPNKNKPVATPIQRQRQAPRQQPVANPQMSEEAILAAAEKIKQKKAQQATTDSEFLNPKPTSDNDDVDMSGLDDLADL